MGITPSRVFNFKPVKIILEELKIIRNFFTLFFLRLFFWDLFYFSLFSYCDLDGIIVWNLLLLNCILFFSKVGLLHIISIFIDCLFNENSHFRTYFLLLFRLCSITTFFDFFPYLHNRSWARTWFWFWTIF